MPKSERNLLQSLFENLRSLYDAGEQIVDAARAEVERLNAAVAPLKGSATAYPGTLHMNWQRILEEDLGKLSDIAPKRNVQIEIETGVYGGVASYKNVNIMADSLKISWKDFFERLKSALEQNAVIKSYRALRHSALPKLQKAIAFARARKANPIHLHEYYMPWRI